MKNTMKTPTRLLLLAVGLCLSGLSAHAAVLIDFGQTGSQTSGNWNNVTTPSNSSTSWNSTYGGSSGLPHTIVGDLINDAGDTTGISLLQIASSGNMGVGGATLTGSDLTTASSNLGQPTSAVTDLLFVPNGSSTTFQLTGLNSSLSYDLTFFSGLDATRAANSSAFTITGAGSSSNKHLIFPNRQHNGSDGEYHAYGLRDDRHRLCRIRCYRSLELAGNLTNP
jgi:hypothetical protein